MRPLRRWLLLVTAIFSLARSTARSADNANAKSLAADRAIALHAARSSPDLEVGGDLPGLNPDTARYLSRDDLLALPQVDYTVTDDANFAPPTIVSGVPLEELRRHLNASPQADLVVAICSDQYRATYPRAYIAAHHPLLVIKVNGQPPAGWPKNVESSGSDMGPYMISHPKFIPSFRILSHQDEAQIPGESCAWNFAMRRQFSAPSHRVDRMPPTCRCKLVTASHGRPVSAATTKA